METLTKIKLGLPITILSVVAIILLGFIVYILTTSLSTAALAMRIGSFYRGRLLGSWISWKMDRTKRR